MSRIGKKPVSVPAGVQVSVDNSVVTVEGPKGKLSYTHRPEVQVAYDDASREVSVTAGTDRIASAYHGLTRSLIQNMVVGVVQGYEKRLEVVGVGYIVSLQGQTLSLRVGYANEVRKTVPEGLQVTCPDQTHVVIRGCDKQLVGRFAAEVRSVRKPEPYKGKGVRYEGEHVKIKPGKAAT
ncbi:MAG: 50S ribosomal protein L6 [Planctomycetaceae bacterium]|nr:50S ribosomal protein L6 [Planctomycetaceae bacterium]